jgi:hypothetical protein
MPSSVYRSFGSAQQKSTFFRIMANRIRFGNDAARRDAFLKALILKAKRLKQRGMELRINGEVVSFKVEARGLGCIPVLEVRERTPGGQTARWAVYQDTEGTGAEEETTAGRATPTSGQAANGEGEWQVVGRRKKMGRMETEGATGRPRVRGTPSKMFGVTGKLCPRPGLTLPNKGRMRWKQIKSSISLKELMKKYMWNRTEPVVC